MKKLSRTIAALLTATACAVILSFGPQIKTEAQVLGTAMAQTITSLTLTNTTNQLVLGTTNVVTISSTAPSASRTYTLDDAGAAAHIGLFSAAPAALQNPPQTLMVTGSNYTNAGTSFTTITGLSFSVAASTNYIMACHLLWENNGGTVDYKIQVTTPSSPTATVLSLNHRPTVSTQSSNYVASAGPIDPAATVTSTTFFADDFSVSLVNGSNAGTLAIQGALHSATGTFTVAVGSFCLVQ